MHGCFPSHLIFFRLHSSQARVTRRRLCTGMDIDEDSPAPPDRLYESAIEPSRLTSIGSSSRLPAGEAASCACQLLEDMAPEFSSSDMVGDIVVSMMPFGTDKTVGAIRVIWFCACVRASCVTIMTERGEEDGCGEAIRVGSCSTRSRCQVPYGGGATEDKTEEGRGRPGRVMGLPTICS